MTWWEWALVALGVLSLIGLLDDLRKYLESILDEDTR